MFDNKDLDVREAMRAEARAAAGAVGGQNFSRQELEAGERVLAALVGEYAMRQFLQASRRSHLFKRPWHVWQVMLRMQGAQHVLSELRKKVQAAKEAQAQADAAILKDAGGGG